MIKLNDQGIKILMDQISDGVLLIDRETELIRSANHTALELLGGSELSGKRLSEVFQVQSIEVIHKTDDVKAFNCLAYTSGDKFKCSQASPQDSQQDLLIFSVIPDEQRREAELLNRYVEIIHVLLVELDTEGNIVRLNRAAAELLGLPASELIGRNWYREFVPDKIRAELTQRILTCIKTGVIDELEFNVNEIQLPDGEIRIISWRNILVKDLTGKVTGIMASGEDITDHWKSPKHALNRNLLEQAEQIGKMGSWEYDLRSRLMRISKQFYRNLGYEPFEKEITYENFFELIHPEDEGRVMEAANKAISQEAPLHVTYRVKHRTGRYIDMLSIGNTYLDDQGHVKLFMGITQDITTHKRLERQLQERNSELSTFIYRTSHSLRSPLTSALGLLNLAKKERTREDAFPYIETIESLVLKLDNILLELINVVLIKGGQPKMELICVPTFILDLLKEYEFQVKEGKVEFLVDMPEELRFNADRQLLRAILANLVENAYKYRKPDLDKVTIKITVRSFYDSLRIEVSDNGVGIPEDAQSRVFDMFFRSSANTHGNGMGLYIVKNAVEKLKGDITLSSVPAEGTTFVITLPLLNDLAEQGEG